ncbi:hypothetical protein BAR24066_00411 [Burkholderia arboris]|uniref:Uncharacterized protein n=1 Tax=Burkholderia arboris TaxID=488730 RepID=A0A9Q9SDJ2_9BURK|nr:hypothetical protein [Burkholderia arboris]VWB12343.1 hypothetical protein BAR24066_00411 [Burkholderia arboris]
MEFDRDLGASFCRFTLGSARENERVGNAAPHVRQLLAAPCPSSLCQPACEIVKYHARSSFR